MLIPVLLFSILVVPQASSTSMTDPSAFSFSSFNPESCSEGELLCMGSVTSNAGYLSMTPEPRQVNSSSTLSAMNQIGRILYYQPVLAWPAIISTTFKIRIIPFPNSSVAGDGIAFVFAQDANPSPPGSHGGFLGLLDRSTQGGFVRQLAVELDTYMNEFDTDDNHVGIDTTSVMEPVASQSLNSIGINLKSGRDIKVKIDYDGLGHFLVVYVGYAETTMRKVLEHRIIMSDTVPNSVFVGFTSSTGVLPESHQILSWTFTSLPLSIHPVDGENVKKDMTIRILLAVVVPIFFGVVVVLIGVMPLIRGALVKGKEGGDKKEDIEIRSRTAAAVPQMFTYKQLAKATNNFSKENLLGKGGFGSVYKGIISNPARTIAVKKISATSRQGEREYLAEICTIGRLRHKNIVQLQGWCHEDEHLLLVYQYMQNGSLDRFIGKDVIDWSTRYKILTGLSSALLYLHKECGNPVVHRDVKPNNVMLDSDFNAHLGDFGLARLLKNEASVTTMLAGTPGYMAPEVGFTGKATPESDVYSFGMVVLEVVCGRRSKGIMEDCSLVDHVWVLYSQNELLGAVDRLLEDKFDKEQAKRALMVGLACLHPDAVFRPSMRKVVHIFLNPNEPIVELPDLRPSGVYISVSSSAPTTTDLGSKCANQRLYASFASSDEISIVYDK